MRYLFPLIVLAVLVGGCASTDTELVIAEAQIVRDGTIATQPPGPKRDQLVADINQGIAVMNVALLAEKIKEAAAMKAAATAATQPVK